jgi:PemK-like, MazF-like toxin of type II toxin-antitoxin system
MTRVRGLGSRIAAVLGWRVRRRPPAGATGAADGPFRVEYSPRQNGRPDPGEVVWAWVPYEEDPSQGKDRPLLVIGRRGKRLVALMLTSKDHDLDAEREARAGRHWMDVGIGAWDRQRRASEVRLDRLLTIDPASVRREGAALDRPTFEAVISRLPSSP